MNHELDPNIIKAAGATGIKSDTPLTDAKMRGGCYASDLMEHARDLERKLANQASPAIRRKLPIQLERSLSTNEPDNYSCEIIRPRKAKNDSVNNPRHYTAHASGVECIQVTQHMNFCLGNAIKYIWRCDDKNDSIEDLRKAIWYIEREIKRRS